MKLVERTKPTDFLIRVIDAYRTQHYDGNLLDLFNWVGNQGVETGNDNLAYIKLIQSGEIDQKAFIRYSNFFNIPDIYLDNNKLDGFINRFIHSYQCDKRVCWMNNEDPSDKSSLYCTYCHEWRKRAITIDQPQYEKWSSETAKLKDDFESSRFFNATVRNSYVK
jgi:hypothetical protein